MRLSKVTRLTGAFFWALFAALMVAGTAVNALSQSTDQDFPTAVTENQLSGKIRARDIGDSRLTTYYYTFNGTQGDLFINIVTRNLNGSINIFMADGLRPLGQILVYADISSSETGRVIYLRKPEKLILRVDGRTPNDDPAEFQVKFAGSFEAVAPTEVPEAPKVSGAALENGNGVRVNSVGTIVATVPKPKPTPRATPQSGRTTARTEAETTGASKTKSPETKPEAETATFEKTISDEKTAEEKTPEETKSAKPKPAVARTTTRRTARSTRPAPAPKKVAEVSDEESKPAEEAKKDEPKKSVPSPARRTTRPKVVVSESTTEPKPDPLASINLVILFKDGSKIERPMNEVLRFSVDRGILTVMAKDGTTAKYSILEVTSVTIQ